MRGLTLQRIAEVTEGTLHLPMHQIIGSDSRIVAAGQGDKD